MAKQDSIFLWHVASSEHSTTSLCQMKTGSTTTLYFTLASLYLRSCWKFNQFIYNRAYYQFCYVVQPCFQATPTMILSVAGFKFKQTSKNKNNSNSSSNNTTTTTSTTTTTTTTTTMTTTTTTKQLSSVLLV